MNPILSDLELRISAIEAEAGLTARRRLHLARTAAGPRPGLGSMLLNAVREFVNPRQYALDVVAAREQAAMRPARSVAAVRGRAVTALPGRQAGQDAELPVAA